MKDGISEWTNLIATVFAFIYLLAADAIIFRLRNAALRTSYHAVKTLLKYVIQASIVIRKLLVQVVDCVARRLHTTSVADLLHDVKG